MKRAIALRGVALFALLAPPVVASADEGMWTLNHFPKALVQQRHGFAPDAAWLDHIRLSSVKFGGGSGSFVSASGLLMTNHHVGSDCIQKLSAEGRDLITDGFLARTPNEEKRCPDLEVGVLQGMDDVTAQVRSGDKPGQDRAVQNAAHKERMSAIERACNKKTGLRCEVVTLYQGAVYDLYRYRKYSDVRLVFAPEGQIAFFGGDPDNFTFPRFDYDVALFRVYDKGVPLRPVHHLAWSQTGAREGDLVFTSGHPGTTSRLHTLAQLEFLRDVTYPTRLADLARLRNVLTGYAATGAEAARQAKTPLFGVENGQKAITGYLQGLQDVAIMARKREAEAGLRARVAADPTQQTRIGAIWDDVAKAHEAWKPAYLRYVLTEGNTLNSKLFGIARTLVRLGEERRLPSERRLREYRDSNLPSVELGLYSPAPIHTGLEVALLTGAFERLTRELGDKDPLVVQVLGGQSAHDRALALVAGTKLGDVAVRRQLAENKSLLDASQDPLLLLARALDPEARTLRKRYEDGVESVVRHAMTELGQAQFAGDGLRAYPDATGTLRISFGTVKGYNEEDRAIPALTTVAGLYERSDKAGGKQPWDLPKRWLAARAKVDGTLPMNFATTNDIIGGNSGSPVVDRSGAVVGLIFDGNIQSLAGNFVFDERQNRAVAVHSAVLLGALRQVYGADALADELSPPQAQPAHPKLVLD